MLTCENISGAFLLSDPIIYLGRFADPVCNVVLVSRERLILFSFFVPNTQSTT